MRHARLQLMATITHPQHGIQRIQVRCDRCNVTMNIDRNGMILDDVPCTGDDDGHVIPERVVEAGDVAFSDAVHGGSRHEDSDMTNSLLNGMRP